MCVCIYYKAKFHPGAIYAGASLISASLNRPGIIVANLLHLGVDHSLIRSHVYTGALL